jgi:hypothetical protein
VLLSISSAQATAERGVGKDQQKRIADPINHAAVPVDPPPQTLAQLQRVTPIALLVGSVCLEPYFVRVDHDRIEPESTELTGDEERNGAGLKSDLSSGRKVIGRRSSRSDGKSELRDAATSDRRYGIMLA